MSLVSASLASGISFLCLRIWYLASKKIMSLVSASLVSGIKRKELL